MTEPAKPLKLISRQLLQEMVERVCAAQEELREDNKRLLTRIGQLREEVEGLREFKARVDEVGIRCGHGSPSCDACTDAWSIRERALIKERDEARSERAAALAQVRGAANERDEMIAALERIGRALGVEPLALVEDASVAVVERDRLRARVAALEEALFAWSEWHGTIEECVSDDLWELTVGLLPVRTLLAPHDPHADPACETCGHVASDHRPGGCGAPTEDEEGDARKCACPKFDGGAT